MARTLSSPSGPPSPGSRRGTLKEQWVQECLLASQTPASFYSGARKIIRPYRAHFTTLDPSLTLADCGFRQAKLTMLTKNYLHEESHAAAIPLWQKRREQEKYGSVGFSTFAHLVKGGAIDAKRSKRASVMGPCLIGVTLTWLDRDHVAIDGYWRTTELFKKFGADLVFIRDVLLPPFQLAPMRVSLTCHFANITAHSMYWGTIAPHLSAPVIQLETLRRADPFMWKWVVKWTARYLCQEHSRGILKFSQALRTRKDITSRLDKSVTRTLQAYLRKNHPGFRNDYEEPEDDDT